MHIRATWQKFCIFLAEAPFKTASDFAIPNDLSLGSITIRGRGVKSGELTRNQVSALEYFIPNYTVGVPMYTMLPVSKSNLISEVLNYEDFR